MPFISYAQNFEDVILNRALSGVAKGFYIDVGANDPLVDSVTHAFYEKGWNGINIEPVPEHAADLLRARPRDINLGIAIGQQEGQIDFWVPDVRGWGTASHEVRDRLQDGGHGGQTISVPVRSLDAVWQEHVTGEVHFLKIDVEGFEKSVLESIDLRQHRPWIIVIESVNAASQQQEHGEWEHILTAADYDFAYFDGVNRFYSAREHQDLTARLAVPPNPYDDYVPGMVMDLHHQLQERDRRLVEMDGQLASLNAQAQQLQTALHDNTAIVRELQTQAKGSVVWPRLILILTLFPGTRNLAKALGALTSP